MSTISLPTSRAAPPGPRPILWTCAEFHRLGDLGLFEGRRAMLIDGVILEEGPMNPPHAIALELVDTAVRAAFGPGWRFRSQSPLVLGQDLDPEPDFAVLAGTSRGSTGHPTTADLVIEVADNSLDFDTSTKRQLYARAGIRDYWVVDVNGRQLLIYRDPQVGDYTLTQTAAPSEVVSPLAAPTVTVRVADLLELPPQHPIFRPPAANGSYSLCVTSRSGASVPVC
jgi:Uma2 family endonuclease